MYTQPETRKLRQVCCRLVTSYLTFVKPMSGCVCIACFGLMIERTDVPDISGIPVYVQISVLAICIIQKYRYTELSVFHCLILFAGCIVYDHVYK